MNKAILMGNLGADPELKYTQGNQAVLKLRLATTETYVDKSGTKQSRTDWHTVVVWGKRAEALNKILAKGHRIAVEGKIQYRTWEDQQGAKKYATDIVATDIHLAGGGQRDQREAEAKSGGTYDRPGSDDFGGGDFGDSDIPFMRASMGVEQ